MTEKRAPKHAIKEFSGVDIHLAEWDSVEGLNREYVEHFEFEGNKALA